MSRRPADSMKCHLFAALAVLALSISGCMQNSWKVTNTEDGQDGSLRALISRANRIDRPVRIAVPTGTYELTLCASDDDNRAGDLDVTSNARVEIVAIGPDVVIRQACTQERVLEAHGGTLSISGLTLTGGWAYLADGGAIRGGDVALRDVIMSNNRGSNGGAVAASALTADGVTITDNRAVSAGGGIFVTTRATIRDSEIRRNSARTGGGIAVAETLGISDTRVADNLAYNPFYLPGRDPLPAPTTGAGILAGSVEGERVTIDGNFLNSCTNRGVQPIPIGEASGGGIQATAVHLKNSTITGNRGGPCGAGSLPIYPPAGIGVRAQSLTLEYVTLADNTQGPTISAERLTSHGTAATAMSPDAVCATVTPNVASHSWFSDASCGLSGTSNQQTDVPFLLGPLTDNGGLVPTRAPAPASPLVDRIVAAECNATSDGRGVLRPQGNGCDIGAVEAQYPPGTGPADLSVEVVSAPASMIAGQSASWQVRLRNNGSNAAAPALRVDVPVALGVESMSATGAATCSQERYVVCTLAPLAPGSSVVVTLTGNLVSYAPEITIGFTAMWPLLEAPFDDDRRSITTEVVVDAALSVSAKSSGSLVQASVFNVGPHFAAASDEHPIRVSFHPAPGVRVENTDGTAYAGLFPPSDSPLGTAYFQLSFTEGPPSYLGAIELDRGLNRLEGVSTIPVYYSPPPDIAVRLHRQQGVFGQLDRIPIDVEILNVGQGRAEDIAVTLQAIQYFTPVSADFQWSPEVGAIEQDGASYTWRIPSVDPGQSLLLHGTVANANGYSLRATSAVANYDPNWENDTASLNISPSSFGTADLIVTELTLSPGPAAGQTRLRATIRNAGDFPFYIPMGVDAVFVQLSWPIPADLTVTVAPPAGWTCFEGEPRCGSAEALPVGSTFVFEYTLTGEFDALTVTVTGADTIPDPEPANNQLTVRP